MFVYITAIFLQIDINEIELLYNIFTLPPFR